MWSKAPTPSIDISVLCPSSSVSARTPLATQSVPARVDNAYWNGMHASSNMIALCWANVRATPRLNVSPATMPRTLPAPLDNAVKHPRRRASTIGSGTSP